MLKFVIVPIALILVGYLVIGPVISDYLNKSRQAEVKSQNL